jgi:hypothetical protein
MARLLALCKVNNTGVISMQYSDETLLFRKNEMAFCHKFEMDHAML